MSLEYFIELCDLSYSVTGRTQNVGRRDRIARGLLTPVVIGAAVWLYYSVPTETATLAAIGVLALLAIVLGSGAITGTCGVYAALGVDTCSCEPEYAGGNRWG